MNGRMEVQYYAEMTGGGRRDVTTRQLKMSDHVGVWEFDIDLKNDLGIEGHRAAEQLNDLCMCFIWDFIFFLFFLQ